MKAAMMTPPANNVTPEVALLIRMSTEAIRERDSYFPVTFEKKVIHILKCRYAA